MNYVASVKQSIAKNDVYLLNNFKQFASRLTQLFFFHFNLFILCSFFHYNFFQFVSVSHSVSNRVKKTLCLK